MSSTTHLKFFISTNYFKLCDIYKLICKVIQLIYLDFLKIYQLIN